MARQLAPTEAFAIPPHSNVFAHRHMMEKTAQLVSVYKCSILFGFLNSPKAVCLSGGGGGRGGGGGWF